MWSSLVNVTCELEKNVYSAVVVGWSSVCQLGQADG